ncbi:hypothetical protein GSI_10430 [Ganoderma sinense ZZ0214-1]|uniref:Uncharacterized protein n=1 Tax=Ganoderma sinense ZZ0214-1 TaxID=1077348 RepID=A0A2G8S0H7_9APHY|nr:hypothetical protein GSI_10430 [Ganoderma sinense ZZ0214-1]
MCFVHWHTSRTLITTRIVSDTFNTSGAGENSRFTRGGSQPGAFDQGKTDDQLQGWEDNDMGGSRAAAGVAGAGDYEGHGQQAAQALMGGQRQQQKTGEKQD